MLDSVLVYIVSKHSPYDCVTQVIVGRITGQVSIQMLNGMIDMFLYGNLCIVTGMYRLAILIRTVLSDFSSREHSGDREKMKTIWR